MKDVFAYFEEKVKRGFPRLCPGVQNIAHYFGKAECVLEK